MKTLAKNKKNSKVSKKELKRMVAVTKKNRTLDEATTPFLVGFLKNLIKEAGEEETDAKSPDEFTDDINQQDFEASLDTNTPKDEFDVQGTNPNVVANAITSIHDWSNKLDEFTNFMNSPDSQSLHKLLATEDRPGSLLRGITRKASDSITRIAGEIAKLKETLNGFINMADKKQRDADINKMQ